MEQTKQTKAVKVLAAALSVVLTLAMIITILPGTALTARAKVTLVNLAELTGNYVAQDGNTLTGALGAGKNYKISVADGATVTLKDVTINGVDSPAYRWAGISCEGDATIILEGTNVVNGFHNDYPGIWVPAGKTLTIAGTGSLTATSYGYASGIGAGWSDACGNIVINGGTITATGTRGAGIGAGRYACGTITINGGTITATGGDGGAGIGGGNSEPCGDITINGGTIIATGGNNSAGIGGGNASASIGNITITGGNITATGNNGGAGIGGGSFHDCGTITISGGNITAAGGEGAAGIGTSEYGHCGNIAISAGIITATGGNSGAGIGTGEYGTCATITIANTVKKLTAEKGETAEHSIGQGNFGTCGSVTVAGEDGMITDTPYVYSTVTAASVIALIDNIGTVEYTDACGEKIAAARADYDLLTDDQKNNVTNADALTAAETAYATLKADHEAADAVIALIDKIGTVAYPNSKSKISAARKAYDALNDNAKALVTNVNTLTAAETTYKGLEDAGKAAQVQTMIENIGEVTNSTDSKNKIEAAKAAYDALSPEQKALVTNYSVLEAAQNAYAEKEAAAATAKDAKKGLPGGAVAGIVIGVVVVLAAAGVCCFFLLKKKGVIGAKAENTPDETAANETPAQSEETAPKQQDEEPAQAEEEPAQTEEQAEDEPEKTEEQNEEGSEQ